MVVDVAQLIASDRKEIELLFSEFEVTSGKEAKAILIKRLCSALRMHRMAEENLIFPELDFEDELFVPKIREEHEVLNYFIEELSRCSGDEENLDCKVKVLAEFFRHHVLTEEREVLDKLNDEQDASDSLSRKWTDFKNEHSEQALSN